MPRTHAPLHFALFALGLSSLGSSCDQKAPPAPAPVQPTVVKKEPTDAAVLERSRRFWANAEKSDWIANYDMLCAEIQREQAPSLYLQGKSNHIYEKMRVTEIVARKDDLIFVRVNGLWTPNHPRAREVELEPGQTLTHDVELIEMWRWEGSEWKYVRPLRAEDFLEQFPELQPSAAGAAPAAAVPAVPSK